MPKNKGEPQAKNYGTHRDAAPEGQAHSVPVSHGRSTSSFAARFGRGILGHGIAALPTALYHFQGELDLSAQAMWFISNILSHKWDEDLPYPSLNKMARTGGVDKTQLYDYKERLCRQGYLYVYSRQDEKGKRETNAYDFAPLFGRLEELIAAGSPLPNVIRGVGDTPEQFSAEMADSSFVARYGRVIASYGITAVPRAVFTHGATLGLSLQQVWFITYIFSYRWDTPLPYPSIKRMSARTGYSTVQLHNIKGELVRAGYLRLVPRYTPEGGQDSNAYDFSGLLDAITAMLDEPTLDQIADEPQQAALAEERSPRRGRRPAVANSKNSLQISGEQLPGVGGANFIGYGGEQLSGVGGANFIAVSGKELPEGKNSTPPPMVVRGSQGKVVASSHEVETMKIETSKRTDSNQISRKHKETTEETKLNTPNYSPYIAGIASDFSRELGDSIHEVSNIKQALNLWQHSGLEEQQFVELMYEAKKLTRRYQSRPTWDTMNNRMAYYFATLRDLSGHKTS